MSGTQSHFSGFRGLWKKCRDSRAFTLAETLLTLALMAVLMSVATVAAPDMLRNSRQRELDMMARTLYMSVQMNLAAAKLSGVTLEPEESFAVRSGRQKRKLVRNERNELEEELYDATDYQLWKTDEAPDGLRDILFPGAAANAELSEGYWIITFDPSVYSVVNAYFSHDDGENGKQSAYFRALRCDPETGTERTDEEIQGRLSELARIENRLGDGALIGYYGPQDATETAAMDMPFALVAGVGPSPENPSDGSPPTPDASRLAAPGDTVTKKTPVNDTDKAENVSHKLYCWIGYGESRDAPIANAEKLVTRLNCWIPADSAFAPHNSPVNVDFTLTVRGVSSMESKSFRYSMECYGAGMVCRDRETGAGILLESDSGAFCRQETREAVNADGASVRVPGWLYSYPVILDSLSDDENVSLHKNQPFKARFPGFIPGEDIMLQFEADVDADIREAAKRASLQALSDSEKRAYGLSRLSEQAVVEDESGAYNWLWKSHLPGWNEYPVSNSLFADADRDGQRERQSPVDESGVYTAKIAYGRHLQNLDAETSGFGENLDAIKSYGDADICAASVRGLQVADIDFMEPQSRDAETAFTPVRNPKLARYDGGGFRIANLRVTADSATGAGLFDALRGDVTLESITLTDPVILAENASGVGGLVGRTEPGSHVTISSVQLYMTEKSFQDRKLGGVLDKWLVGGKFVGGLIGYAAGDVTITAADGVPTFAATVVNAHAPDACAGGLAGYVEGKLEVSDAWADCYVSGAHIGGLAGHCGADSAFQRCYAAGFAVGGSAATVAGFAPCGVADVSDAYSIFNLDGVSAALKYGMFRSVDSAANAYFVYGGAVNRSDGAAVPVIDRDSLQTALSDENGFRAGDSESVPYGLTDGLSATPYPYPVLAGTPYRHYNDYLASNPPELRSVSVLRPWTLGRVRREELFLELENALDGDAKAAVCETYLLFSRNGDPESVPVREENGAQYVEAWTQNRISDNDRFIGWYAEREFRAYLSALVGDGTPSEAAPMLCLTESGVRDADAALLDKSAKLLYDGADGGALYAVYEHAEPFAVMVESRYFDAERMNAALRALLKAEAPENEALRNVPTDGNLWENEAMRNLLSGNCALDIGRWDAVPSGEEKSLNELMREAFEGDCVSIQSVAVNPADPAYVPTVQDYALAPFDADGETPPEIGKAICCARFDSDGKFMEFCAVSDADSAFGAVSVENDRPSAYIALHPRLETPSAEAEITLTLELIFRDTEDSPCLRPDDDSGEDVWTSLDAFREALPGAPFAAGETGEALVAMKSAAGNTLRQHIGELTFEGFTLDEAQSALDIAIIPGATDTFRLYYDRNSDEA